MSRSAVSGLSTQTTTGMPKLDFFEAQNRSPDLRLDLIPKGSKCPIDTWDLGTPRVHGFK